VYCRRNGGVGQNSKGQIFVYTRTGHPVRTLGDNRTFLRGGSRLFVFDKTGKFERELGQDVYGFNAAIGLRVDPQDNVWTIDVAASQVVKFDPEGRVALVLGRKPEAINVASGASGGGGRRSRGRWLDEAQRKAVAPVPLQHRKPVAARRAAAVVEDQAEARPDRGCPVPPSIVPPTSRGIAPGTSTLPTASPTPTGSRSSTRTAVHRQWGSTGSENGQFMGVKSLAVDAQGTSTSPTPATSASRCSTATATSSRSSATSARR
jgi:hypothetical protein